MQAQELSSRRSRFSKAWPLLEFWRNKVDEHVTVMDEFVALLVKEALAKKSASGEESAEKGLSDDATLLDHLMTMTDGWFARLSRMS